MLYLWAQETVSFTIGASLLSHFYDINIKHVIDKKNIKHVKVQLQKEIYAHLLYW